ncbi:hypothetical protein LTR86_009681 [Recurvomyces mirabilis]|nr:hypothetical protein LTR86_009681 [Recurvomyces mirabilis]
MSGLEVIGFVFGACGFIGQVIHYSRKYRQKKRARVSARTTQIITTQTSSNNGQVTNVRRASQSQVAVQLDHGRTVREQWQHFSEIQRDNNEIVRAGIRAIERSYDSRDRANEVAWETVRAMHAVYVEENRRFTFTTLVMASLITFLAFFLGVYTGENSILKQFHYPSSWNFAALEPEASADSLQHSAVTVAKGAISGFTFLPIQLPWFTLKAMFDGLAASLGAGAGGVASRHSIVSEKAVTSYVGSAKTAAEHNATLLDMIKTLSIPAVITDATAMPSDAVYSALSSLTWFWCLPSNFILDLIVTTLQFCFIPRTITISILGVLGTIIILLFCFACLQSVQTCEGKGDLWIELILLSFSTPFCVMSLRWLSDVLGLSEMMASALVILPYAMMLMGGRWCDSCYVICAHQTEG